MAVDTGALRDAVILVDNVQIDLIAHMAMNGMDETHPAYQLTLQLERQKKDLQSLTMAIDDITKDSA